MSQSWLTSLSILYLYVCCGASVYLLLARKVKSESDSRRREILSSLGLADERTIVGFFHPYCNAGGGGERVLWTAIAYIQRTQPEVVCAIYTGDTDATKENIIEKAQARFGITLNPETLAFVFLTKRHYVDDKSWPRFTLIGQSLGSMILAYEALQYLVPDVFIDSMGYAFTYPLIRFLRLRSTRITTQKRARLPIIAYTHYPTISTNMLQRVRSRQASYNNTSGVAGSNLKSWGKLLYYHIFAFLYSSSLSLSSPIMVNSTWTKKHVDALLGIPHGSDGARIVYPPCDTKALTSYPVDARERVILSVAQFRPEKDHPTQIKALSLFLSSHPEYREGSQKVSLVLLGSARNEEDMERVNDLKIQSTEQGVQNNVLFVLNAPYEELISWLSRSSVGISSMVDEHFGINIVEYMASGLIPLVHRSGGPLNDIVTESTGFHASSAEEYADILDNIFGRMGDTKSTEMRLQARERSQLFGVQEFEKGWSESWNAVLATR